MERLGEGGVSAVPVREHETNAVGGLRLRIGRFPDAAGPKIREKPPHPADFGVQRRDAAFLCFVRNVGRHPAEGTSPYAERNLGKPGHSSFYDAVAGDTWDGAKTSPWTAPAARPDFP